MLRQSSQIMVQSVVDPHSFIISIMSLYGCTRLGLLSSYTDIQRGITSWHSGHSVTPSGTKVQDTRGPVQVAHHQRWNQTKRSGAIEMASVNFVTCFLLASMSCKRLIIHLAQIRFLIACLALPPYIKERQAALPLRLVPLQKGVMIYTVGSDLGSHLCCWQVKSLQGLEWRYGSVAGNNPLRFA